MSKFRFVAFSIRLNLRPASISHVLKNFFLRFFCLGLGPVLPNGSTWLFFHFWSLLFYSASHTKGPSTRMISHPII
jgi:hypothetical protein